MEKKIAVLTLCYNEEETLGAVLENWKGNCEKHLVLHTDRPWHGPDQPPDGSEDITGRYSHAEFVRLNWRSETAQRNWGLGKLHEYDMVAIVDADELYTQEDIKKIIEKVSEQRGVNGTQDVCFRVPVVRTYFKSHDLVIDPPDSHLPVVVVNPKKILFVDKRAPSTDQQVQIPGVTMHHLSYAKSDIKLWHKIQQFEHHDEVHDGWFDRTIKNFNPDLTNVRPYGIQQSKLVGYSLPDELRKLL